VFTPLDRFSVISVCVCVCVCVCVEGGGGGRGGYFGRVALVILYQLVDDCWF
jgi:hypothetical protein